MLHCPQCSLPTDYVPRGERATAVTNVRPADGFYRCSAQVGDDIQSGPIYCGDRAALIADGPAGGVAAACARHAHVLRELERPGAGQ